MSVNSFARALRVFVFFLAAVFAVSGARAAEHVMFSLLGSSSILPYLLAYDSKMFEKEGIEAEHAVFGAPNQVIDSFLTGRSDVGPGAAAGITLVANSQFPGTLKVFALQGGRLEPSFIRGSALVVPTTSDVEGFADLKGKKIGTLPGIQWRSITRHLLRKAGLNPETDAQIVELGLPLQVQALLANTVDALLVVEPNVSLAIATGYAKIAVDNPTDRYIGSPFFNGAMIMTSKFAEERPEVAKKVVKVMFEAAKMVDADYEKYKPLLVKYGFYSEESVKDIPLGYLVMADKFDDQILDSYQKFADMFYDEGAMEEPVDVREQMLPREYLPE